MEPRRIGRDTGRQTLSRRRPRARSWLRLRENAATDARHERGLRAARAHLVLVYFGRRCSLRFVSARFYAAQ